MQKICSFWKRVTLDFWREDCLTRAASLAYTTLFAIVPLFALSFAVLSAFPVFNVLKTKVQQFIIDNFVTTSAQTISKYIQFFLQQINHLSIFGLISFLITAVFLIFSVEHALNHIWKVPNRRNLISAFLMYWAILTLTPLVIGIGIVFNNYLVKIFGGFGISLVPLIFWFIPFLFVFLTFMLCYLLIPNCRVSSKQASGGALAAAILFELIKYLFALYITNFSSYTLIYGALASIPIFLIWLYLVWLIALFGAIVGRSV